MPALTALPKHMQISESLIRDIQAGRLVEGERLPPERSMAESLGTSVGTLRKSLQHLEEKGFLNRIQGSGNYVRTNTREAGVYALFRLERPQGGGLPRAELISVDNLHKGADLPAFGTAAPATRIRRLRLLDDTPAALEEIWLDGAAGQLSAEQMSESLYRTYQTRLTLWIARAEDQVHLAPFPDWTPPVLAPPGQMAGFVERRAWATTGAEIEYSRTWYHPQRARYIQRLR